MIRLINIHRWLWSLLAIVIPMSLVGCGETTPEPTAEPIPSSEIIAADPLPPSEALPPVALAIPAIGLHTDVTPMGWRIAQTDNGDTTVWEIPYTTAGWHVTSAGAGSAGNVVISGHQVVGEAVFVSLALGEVEVGHRIYLSNEENATYVYEVTTVAEPIPLVGATVQDLEAAEAFAAPSEEPTLTLITGWPDFSTTHYLFVSAEYVGVESTN